MSVSFVQIAFERGYVRVLQYLHEHGWLLPYSLPGSIGITSDVARDEASVIACLRQKVLATIAVEDYPEPLTSYANEAWKNLANSEKLSRAIADGHVEAIQWALTLVRGYQPIVVYSDAARAGHLHVLRWLASEWSSPTPTDIETVVHSASALGHLDILEWLHELYAYSCTAYVMDAAALSGQLRIVQWLYERGGAGAVTRESMDYAAGGDHLPLVQWFHAHSSAGCTTSAMDLAATNGHLDVVQWLHDNRTKGCTIHAMSQAAVAGHLDVVIWLHKHRSEGCNEYGMTQSNSDVLQWLLPNRLLTDIAQVMELAARRGDLHELQMLWTIRPDGLSVNVAECAAELGHQGILERIHGQYPGQFDTERVRSRSSKYSHVMTWLEPLFDTK